ncbi:hypothetical protein GH714_005532 [Hevea brasiliensis]|uniref:Serpin domain-containing protein n=1 Tax=Hevea brasiliensis TaxID=3981 RepID=A0A6A6MBL8_HEVBR|nr:hypothetical protein GH714_005532 [Hevea brasiliensis]
MGLREAIVSQNDVALGISKHVLLTEGNISDSVVSPLSIQLVLGLIAVGSKGPTLDQLLSFLKSKSNDHLISFFSELVSVVFADGSANGGPLFSFANGVWWWTSLSLLSLLSKRFWKISTGLLVMKLISKPRGAWNENFDESTTKDYDFYPLNGSSVHVPFMTGNKNQFIRAFDGFKVLRFPYEQGEDERRSFMYFFLPDAKDGLPALVEKVGSESGFLDHHLPQQKVEVGEFRILGLRLPLDLRLPKL